MKKQTFYIFLIMSFVFLLGIPKTYATEFTSVDFKSGVEFPQAFDSFKEEYPDVLTPEWKQNLIDSINQKYPQPYKISFIRFICNINGGFSYGNCSSSNAGAGYILFVNTYVFNSQPNLYYRLYNDTNYTFRLEGDTNNRDIYYFATSKSGYKVDSSTGTLTGNQQNVLGTDFISLQTSKAFAPILYLKGVDNSVFYYNFNGITSNVELPPSPTDFSNDTIQLTPNITLSPNSTIKLEDYINPLFQEDSEPAYYDLNTFNDSKIITYKINDEVSGIDKNLKIKLLFNNQPNINSSDISIYKYGSDILTTYSSFDCNNQDNNSVCLLDLSYDVSSSNTDKLMFDFVFSNSSYSFYDVSIFSTNDFDSVYKDYDSLEYEFSTIDMEEISGIVFTYRNYGMLKYLPTKVFDFNMFYEGDSWFVSLFSPRSYVPLQLSSTYLYKNTNNDYVFADNIEYTPYEPYKGMNANVSLTLPYGPDYSLINSNKFPILIVENPNYLGDGDTENLPFTITYNSSIFSKTLKNSVVQVNEGVTSNITITTSNTSFIDNNGSSVVIDSGNTGMITYTSQYSEDISVFYTSMLEYFKNKISIVFEFVTEFFNSLPIKVQNAYIFIFVLILALIIFRLLL